MKRIRDVAICLAIGLTVGLTVGKIAWDWPALRAKLLATLDAKPKGEKPQQGTVYRPIEGIDYERRSATEFRFLRPAPGGHDWHVRVNKDRQTTRTYFPGEVFSVPQDARVIEIWWWGGTSLPSRAAWPVIPNDWVRHEDRQTSQ